MNPDFGGVMRGTFAISADDRREAWAAAIEQTDLVGCDALAQRAYARIDLLRAREACPAVEREALELIARRRAQLIQGAASAAPASAPGGIPAVQAAQVANRPNGDGDDDERGFRW